MQRDYLFRAHGVYRADVVQIWSVLSAITNWDFDFTRLRQTYIFDASNVLPQDIFQFVVMPLQRIKFDEDGVVGGMQIAHACNRFHFEQAQKFSDVVMSVKRDLLTEVN
jgi:hypothetical protein